jgi:hypothetical protein
MATAADRAKSIEPFLARWALAVLLLATLAKGLAWSMVVPPLHAPDELPHFFRAQITARQGMLDLEKDLLAPLEIGVLYDLVQMPRVFGDRLPFDFSNRPAIDAALAQLRDPFVQHYLVLQPALAGTWRFAEFHPPVYYALLAGVEASLGSESILVRLAAGRWLSVALGVASVALAYAIGGELAPDEPLIPLALATLVSFQPMFSFVTSVNGNEVLQIALCTACLLLGLRVLRGGLTVRRALALGLFLSMGLLTKTSFLAVVLLTAFVAARDLRARVEGRALRLDLHALRLWALVALLVVLLTAWWYVTPLSTGGTSILTPRPGKTPGATPTPLPAAGQGTMLQLIGHFVYYPWFPRYLTILGHYWGNFGMLETPISRPLAALLVLLTVVTAATTALWLGRALFASGDKTRPRMMLLLGAATLCYVAFYTYVDFRFWNARWRPFGLQGRYFLAPIAGQMAWLAAGTMLLVPRRARPLCLTCLAGGMIGLNFYALFDVIAPRYYGAGSTATLLERATILQPVSFSLLSAICLAFAALAAALAVSLWQQLRAAGQPASRSALPWSW